jgi:hypothetical protein
MKEATMPSAEQEEDVVLVLGYIATVRPPSTTELLVVGEARGSARAMMAAASSP